MDNEEEKTKEITIIDTLLELPYETITLFDGNSIHQRSVVKYSEVTKLINDKRRSLLEKGFHYVEGKLIPI